MFAEYPVLNQTIVEGDVDRFMANLFTTERLIPGCCGAGARELGHTLAEDEQVRAIRLMLAEHRGVHVDLSSRVKASNEALWRAAFPGEAALTEQLAAAQARALPDGHEAIVAAELASLRAAVARTIPDGHEAVAGVELAELRDKAARVDEAEQAARDARLAVAEARSQAAESRELAGRLGNQVAQLRRLCAERGIKPDKVAAGAASPQAAEPPAAPQSTRGAPRGRLRPAGVRDARVLSGSGASKPAAAARGDLTT